MAAIGRCWGCSPVTNNSLLEGSFIVLGVLGCFDKFSTHASLLGSLSLADLHYLKTDLLEKQGIPWYTPPTSMQNSHPFCQFSTWPFWPGEHPVRLQDVQADPIPPVLESPGAHGMPWNWHSFGWPHWDRRLEIHQRFEAPISVVRKPHNLWPLKWKYDWNMTHDNLYRIQWCHHVKHSQNWLNEHLNVVYDVHDFRCSGYQGVDPCPCTCSDGNLNLLSRNCAPSNMSN